MFNHARTLLVNLTGSDSYFANVPGDEPIPSTFHTLELPTYLDTCRSRIFGSTPDRAMLNYRAAQLLTLIEATELQEYVLDLDSRITYSNSGEFLADKTLFEPQVRRITGTSSDILTIVGSSIAPDSTGVCGYRYDVEVDINSGGSGLGGGGGSAFYLQSVTVNRLTPPTASEQSPLILTSGLGGPFDLPYSGYRFTVHPDDDSTWTIRGFLRPQRTLSEIDTLLRSIGEPVLIQLFGVSNEEPYRTFKNCWNNHPEMAYRLAGFVLAMIYRTNEIYALQGGE